MFRVSVCMFCILGVCRFSSLIGGEKKVINMTGIQCFVCQCVCFAFQVYVVFVFTFKKNNFFNDYGTKGN